MAELEWAQGQNPINALEMNVNEEDEANLFERGSLQRPRLRQERLFATSCWNRSPRFMASSVRRRRAVKDCAETYEARRKRVRDMDKVEKDRTLAKLGDVNELANALAEQLSHRHPRRHRHPQGSPHHHFSKIIKKKKKFPGKRKGKN